ncbi:substrate-binding domain-containing protein [Methylobacterium iners]|uniref:PBP domain-containing protein n=1 Tax=Methylobacterium iners TaxID=418707 RepID=A0ABQ4RS09_9HYPH|nr:substrate-binding domain-containing protein [Methylobacterium iners]GJD92989.1 hypothetical protein OCOJLMKI_0175 [Methylobacterium iners]
MLRKNLAIVLSTSVLAVGILPVAADEIKVGGTGAAFALMQRLAEAFSAAHPGDTVEVVPGLGSSGGIAAVAEGALHLSVSSRMLKPEEKAKGISSAPFLDTPYIFVTSHAKPQALAKADVVAIYDGRLTAWPDGKEIKPVLRPKSESATLFLLAKFDGMGLAMDKLRQRPDVPVAATDQDNLEAAEKIPNSFAGMTLLQFTTEKPKLRTVSLDGMQASTEGNSSPGYPLSIQLFSVAKEKPDRATARFVSFLRTDEAARIIATSGATSSGKSGSQ